MSVLTDQQLFTIHTNILNQCVAPFPIVCQVQQVLTQLTSGLTTFARQLMRQVISALVGVPFEAKQSDGTDISDQDFATGYSILINRQCAPGQSDLACLMGLDYSPANTGFVYAIQKALTARVVSEITTIIGFTFEAKNASGQDLSFADLRTGYLILEASGLGAGQLEALVYYNYVGEGAGQILCLPSTMHSRNGLFRKSMLSLGLSTLAGTPVGMHFQYL